MAFETIAEVGKQLITQKDALRGLTTTDGKSIISEMKQRDNQLQTVQVSQMLLKLQQGKQQGLFTIKGRYSKKIKHGDTGEKIEVYTGKLEGYDVEVLDGSAETIKFIESAARPAKSGHIMVHLSRLAAHKPIGGRNDQICISIILEDLSIDLFGCSEFAIAQACSEFRKNINSDFFPGTGNFISRCEELTNQYAELYSKLNKFKLKLV